MKLQARKDGGFTLLELMIVAAILLIALTGLLSTYATCLELAETTKNSNLALCSAQDMMERIRNSPDLAGMLTYNATHFTISGISAGSSDGYVYVDNSNSSLFNVTIGACWRQRGSRIIGECQNAGGNVTFSDANGNRILDSPVQLSCLMTQR